MGNHLPSAKRGTTPQFWPVGVVAKRVGRSLGTEVRLGPGDIMLDWELAPLPKKGDTAALQFSAHVLWPNGWMDQDDTWYGGRPRRRPHCVRWGPSTPERGTAATSFLPISIVAQRSPISANAGHLYSC